MRRINETLNKCMAGGTKKYKIGGYGQKRNRERPQTINGFGW